MEYRLHQPSFRGLWITNLLQGLKHVTAYIDNIVVTGSTDEEHLKNLEEVLNHLRGLWITFCKDLKHVTAYIDDIVVIGSTDEEHLKNLEEVLNRLSTAGVHLKMDKCFFFAKQVEYLGHLIDEHGLHPTPTKVKAILEASTPHDVFELRSSF